MGSIHRLYGGINSVWRLDQDEILVRLVYDENDDMVYSQLIIPKAVEDMIAMNVNNGPAEYFVQVDARDIVNIAYRDEWGNTVMDPAKFSPLAAEVLVWDNGVIGPTNLTLDFPSEVIVGGKSDTLSSVSIMMMSVSFVIAYYEVIGTPVESLPTTKLERDVLARSYLKKFGGLIPVTYEELETSLFLSLDQDAYLSSLNIVRRV